MMSNSGIKTEDWRHIEMYEEYMDMRKNCEKGSGADTLPQVGDQRE